MDSLGRELASETHEFPAYSWIGSSEEDVVVTGPVGGPPQCSFSHQGDGPQGRGYSSKVQILGSLHLLANALRTTRSSLRQQATGGSASPLARRSLGGGDVDDGK